MRTKMAERPYCKKHDRYLVNGSCSFCRLDYAIEAHETARATGLLDDDGVWVDTGAPASPKVVAKKSKPLRPKP